MSSFTSISITPMIHHSSTYINLCFWNHRTVFAMSHARHSNSSCCCACVDQGTVKIVERFGQFNRIAYPGFNCVCCLLGTFENTIQHLDPPFKIVQKRCGVLSGDFIAGTINMRIRQLDVSVETKTRDNVFVHLVVSVQYQVHDVLAELTDEVRWKT